MRVHAALAATVAAHSISTVFGVMGDANMFLIGSLAREPGVRYVAAANEAGAVLMAAGYASARKGLGLATVTYGPGLANSLGAVVSVARQRVPVVLVTGETPAARPAHTQRIDHAAHVAPTGAGFVRAESAASAATDLAAAMRQALTERRPVIFSCPVDFTFEDAAPAEPLADESAAPSPLLDPAALDAALGIIATARRPIVLAGAGCVAPDASAQLRGLGDVLGAPLTTTLPAKGLFGADPHDLGVFGSLSTPRAVDAILASDCVIAVGAGLSPLTGGGEGWPYLAGKSVVQCDIDPAALGRRVPVDGGVVADARTFAETATASLREIEHSPSTFRSTATAATPAAAPGDALDLGTALSEINRALPAARAVTVDGGRFTAEAVARVDVPRASAWTCSFLGLGAVGNAVATAIGVGCALPDSTSVAIVGDGGFMLGGLAELHTAVRHEVDLVVVVCNDGAYGAEYRKLQARDAGVETSLFDWPDLASVARALGGLGLTVRTVADLHGLDARIAARDRPVLIDVQLDPARIA